jgi:hypothetical protein
MADVRLHINTLWQWYSDNGLADCNFLRDFPLQTTQRLWELEIAWLLHNCGFNLSNAQQAIIQSIIQFPYIPAIR